MHLCYLRWEEEVDGGVIDSRSVVLLLVMKTDAESNQVLLHLVLIFCLIGNLIVHIIIRWA